MPFKCSAEHFPPLKNNEMRLNNRVLLRANHPQALKTNATAAFQKNYCDWQKHKLSLKVLCKHINKHNNPISPFPWEGTMSAVELRGPGFVFIGSKLWYASVSNVPARIKCRSPETWSPHCSREILDTVLSSTMCRGSPGTTSAKEIESQRISVVYLHVPNTVIYITCVCPCMFYCEPQCLQKGSTHLTGICTFLRCVLTLFSSLDWAQIY